MPSHLYLNRLVTLTLTRLSLFKQTCYPNPNSSFFIFKQTCYPNPNSSFFFCTTTVSYTYVCMYACMHACQAAVSITVLDINILEESLTFRGGVPGLGVYICMYRIIRMYIRLYARQLCTYKSLSPCGGGSQAFESKSVCIYVCMPVGCVDKRSV